MSISIISIRTKKKGVGALGKKDIYVKKDEIREYDKFLIEVKRQGTSASAVFRKARIAWMITHAPGNTVTRLTSFIEMKHDDRNMQIGRVRQLALEYARTMGKEGIKRSWIRDKTIEIMNLKAKYLIHQVNDIVKWLREQDILVWQ